MEQTGRIKDVKSYIVVVFDMCSSSNIIEDLTLSGNLHILQKLIVEMKQWLIERSRELSFTIYKFTGDGWILFFELDSEGEKLICFLNELCGYYKKKFDADILPVLEIRPQTIGMTFGVEKGDLVQIAMEEKTEYIGRPINIACRLQKAAKEKKRSSNYEALASRQVFNSYFQHLEGIKALPVEKSLRNIRRGNEYRCMKILLSPD